MIQRMHDQKCPDCGTSMEPRNTVSSGQHLSRWWRCPNSQCAAEWLLPATAEEQELLEV